MSVPANNIEISMKQLKVPGTSEILLISVKIRSNCTCVLSIDFISNVIEIEEVFGVS